MKLVKEQEADTVPDTGRLPPGADSSLFRLLFQKEEWRLCPGPGSTHALPLTQLLPVKSPIVPSPSPEAGVLDSHHESSGPTLGNCQELQLPNSLILTHSKQGQLPGHVSQHGRGGVGVRGYCKAVKWLHTKG